MIGTPMRTTGLLPSVADSVGLVECVLIRLGENNLSINCYLQWYLGNATSRLVDLIALNVMWQVLGVKTRGSVVKAIISLRTCALRFLVAHSMGNFKTPPPVVFTSQHSIVVDCAAGVTSLQSDN